MFGAGGAKPSDSQIINVGGSVERLDLAGWLKLNAGKNAKPWRTTCAAQARCGRTAGLSGLGVS
jgi:hypothetical protein